MRAPGVYPTGLQSIFNVNMPWTQSRTIRRCRYFTGTQVQILLQEQYLPVGTVLHVQTVRSGARPETQLQVQTDPLGNGSPQRPTYMDFSPVTA